MKSKEQIEKLREFYIDMGTSLTDEDTLKDIIIKIATLNWVLRDEE